MDDLTAAIESLEAVTGECYCESCVNLRCVLAAARASQEAAAELDALKHDIARYVAIAAEQATELSALKAERDVLFEETQETRGALLQFDNWVIGILVDRGIELGDEEGGVREAMNNLAVGVERLALKYDAAIAASAPDKEGK